MFVRITIDVKVDELLTAKDLQQRVRYMNEHYHGLQDTIKTYADGHFEKVEVAQPRVRIVKVKK